MDRQLREQGWLGVAIPEEHGGLGLGRLELCVLAEEIGRAVAPIPFSSTLYFFTEALLASGSSCAKEGAALEGCERRDDRCFRCIGRAGRAVARVHRGEV